MKKPISISFAPNFQKDDLLLSVRLIGSLLVGRSDTQSIPRVKKLLQETIGVESNNNISLFSSARAGLYYTLKSFNLQRDDEVLIQAFTCVAVPCAVKWANLKPVFVDIDKDTYNFDFEDLKKKITNRTRAIIIQHTFGIAGPISEVIKLASENNILVIEDCAHVIGDTYQNKTLGTLGDVGVFSFGRDKALSSVFGGAIICNNSKFQQKIKQCEEGLRPAPLWFALQQLLYPIIYAVSLSLYNIGLGKALLWLSARVGLLSKAVYKRERTGHKPHFLEFSLHPSLSSLLTHQLEKLKTYNLHRQHVSNEFIKKLDLKLPADHPYLRIPLQVADKARFLKKAQGMGIHLGNWYRGPIDPPSSAADVFNYTACPNAENLAIHTINLPTHVNISEEDVEKIISLCKTEQ
jgi:dTDP-4-amino-4,6-dideoxygalactose transaminase